MNAQTQQPKLPLRIPFNALPRPDRERLIAATKGQGVPPILAEQAGVWGATIGWAVLAIAAAIGLLAALAQGYGSLYQPVLEWAWLLLLIPLAFLLAIAVIDPLYRLLRRRNRPYAAGRFLFPLDYIDTREEPLEILPLSALTQFNATHHHTNGAYTHTAITFTFGAAGTRSFNVRGKDQAERRIQALRDARAALQAATTVEQLSALDIFINLRMREAGFAAANNLKTAELDGGPRVQPLPKLLKRRFLAALGIGAVLGLGVFAVRNVLSDNAAWAEVKASGDIDDLEWYAADSWLHGGEALAEATRLSQTRCEALESEEVCQHFIDRYGTHEKAATAKTEWLPRAALKAAGGDPGKVRDFLKKYPDSVAEAEARSQLHAAFAAAFEQFRTQANTSDPDLLPFVQRLLAYLEQAPDGDVTVRFLRRTSPSLAEADAALEAELGQSARFVRVSPYYAADNLGPYETKTIENLNRAFGSIFTASLLQFVPGDAFVADDAAALRTLRDTPLEPGAKPELDIVYSVTWSGASYSNEAKTAAFVGIAFEYGALFRVPGEGAPLVFTLRVEPPDTFNVSFSRSSYSTQTDAPDAQVYEEMGNRAFDQFGEKMRSVFFDGGKSGNE